MNNSPLERYRTLVESAPELFRHEPSDGVQILLGNEDIAEAMRQQQQQLAAHGLPADYATVGVVFQDQYLTMLRDAVRFPDGRTGTYLRIIHARSKYAGVAILPVSAGKIVLIRHFRHATRHWHWEIPRGFASADAPEASVIAELQEEIGADLISLQPMGVLYPDSGLMTSPVHLYFAAVTLGTGTDSHEAISDIHPVTLAELDQMIREGQINDGFTLAAVAAAKARGWINSL